MNKYQKQTRKEELLAIFEAIDDKKDIIMPMIDDVVFLEDQLQDLRRLPFIRVNPSDPSQQKATPAAKQYKECSQSYMNAIRILSGILRNAEGDVEDDLLAQLEEFSR